MIAVQTHASLTIRFGSFFKATAPDRAEWLAFLQQDCYESGAAVEWLAKIQ